MKRNRLIMFLASLQIVAMPPSLFGESAYERELAKITDERDRALADAADPINRRYKAALEQLLRRATQNNELQTALKIQQTLQSLGGSAGQDAASDIVGRWPWTAGRVVTILSDGKFSVDTGGGTWRWTNAAKREFTMIWDRGDFVDTFVLNADGTAITGTNNKGDKIKVSRLK